MLKKVCIAAVILLLLCSGFSVFAASAATVSMQFTGDEADLAGFAQCEITVTPGANGAKSGYYVIYYTDGQQVLSGYDEATAIKITGSTAKGGISDGRMLPQGAKGIAVFESATYYLAQTPDISQAIATAEIPAAKRTPDLGEVQFSFGALSDTHMNYQQYDRGAYEKLRYSMDFFAKQKMDAVIITGDMTGDRGDSPDLEAQYEKHLEILNASDFNAKKVYEGIGNHGNTPADADLMNKYLGGKDEKHPYTDSPYYHVLFEGKGKERDNLFIFMAQEIESSGDSAAYDNFSKQQIDWLEGLLSKYGNGRANVFIIIHSPFLQYGAGDIENGAYTNCITLNPKYPQTVRLQSLLEIYNNAIVMSGHSHISFYENANYSDVGNSFARTVHIGSNCQPNAYGGASTLTKNFDGRGNVTPTYGSEGYTVEVYEDFIVYTGYNFSTGQKIPAACLLIPTEAYGARTPEELPTATPEEAPGEAAPSSPSAGIAPEEETAGPAAPNETETPNSSRPEDPFGSVDSSIGTDDVYVNFVEEEEKSYGWIWAVVGGVVALVAAAVVTPVLILRKKK